MEDPEVAIAAARAGAAVVSARFGTPLARYDKGAWDFATDADIETERAILGILRSARPADAFVGEELGQADGSGNGRTWLVDPLCGTLNFAAQTPLMAVNVALRDGDKTVAAACAVPPGGDLLWTDGRASWLRRDGGDSPLQPSAATGIVDVNADDPDPDSDYFRAARLLTDRAFMAAFRPRVLSTSLALAWVATGQRAGYVTDGDMRDSVHFAAGIALCKAAGCVVTGLRGEPLYAGTTGLVAAADSEVHAELIKIIGRQFR